MSKEFKFLWADKDFKFTYNDWEWTCERSVRTRTLFGTKVRKIPPRSIHPTAMLEIIAEQGDPSEVCCEFRFLAIYPDSFPLWLQDSSNPFVFSPKGWTLLCDSCEIGPVERYSNMPEWSVARFLFASSDRKFLEITSDSRTRSRPIGRYLSEHEASDWFLRNRPIPEYCECCGEPIHDQREHPFLCVSLKSRELPSGVPDVPDDQNQSSDVPSGTVQTVETTRPVEAPETCQGRLPKCEILKTRLAEESNSPAESLVDQAALRLVTESLAQTGIPGLAKILSDAPSDERASAEMIRLCESDENYYAWTAEDWRIKLGVAKETIVGNKKTGRPACRGWAAVLEWRSANAARRRCLMKPKLVP